MIRDAEALPESHPGRAGMIEHGRALRARWGCPDGVDGADHTARTVHTLDPDLAAEAAHVARLTGTPQANTCPLACVTYANPWVVDLTRAAVLAADLHVPIEDTTGRPIARVDVQALAALKSAQGDVWESNRAEAERKAAQAASRGRRG